MEHSPATSLCPAGRSFLSVRSLLWCSCIVALLQDGIDRRPARGYPSGSGTASSLWPGRADRGRSRRPGSWSYQLRRLFGEYSEVKAQAIPGQLSAAVSGGLLSARGLQSRFTEVANTAPGSTIGGPGVQSATLGIEMHSRAVSGLSLKRFLRKGLCRVLNYTHIELHDQTAPIESLPGPPRAEWKEDFLARWSARETDAGSFETTLPLRQPGDLRHSWLGRIHRGLSRQDSAERSV